MPAVQEPGARGRAGTRGTNTSSALRRPRAPSASRSAGSARPGAARRSRRPCGRRPAGSPSASPLAAGAAAGPAPPPTATPAGRRGDSRARQRVSSASRLPTPAITPWSSSRALSGAVPRPTRARKAARETSAASGPTCEKSGAMSARPSRRLSRSASRPPSANSSENRSQCRGAGGSSTTIRPAIPRCRPSSGPRRLDPEELAAPVAAQQPLPDQRRRDLARRVRAADVGVAIVDRDDLAVERAVDLNAGALGLGELGHEADEPRGAAAWRCAGSR